MSDLIERAKKKEARISALFELHARQYTEPTWRNYFEVGFNKGWDACAQSERTRIADEIEALSQKTPIDAMVTALLAYADKLRKND